MAFKLVLIHHLSELSFQACSERPPQGQPIVGCPAPVRTKGSALFPTYIQEAAMLERKKAFNVTDLDVGTAVLSSDFLPETTHGYSMWHRVCSCYYRYF